MRILSRILRLSLRHKWRLAGVYTCTVGTTVAYLFLPRLFGLAVDRVSGIVAGEAYAQGAIVSVALLILVASVVRGVLAFGQTYLEVALGEDTVFDIRNTFHDHVQHLSFAFHDKQHTGNLMSRAISDVESIRVFVVLGLVRTPYLLALFITVSVLMLRLDWRLGLLSISFLPIVAFLSVLIRLQLGRLWSRVMEDMGKMSTVLQENLTGVRVVRAFAAESLEEEKFSSHSMDVASHWTKAARLQAFNSTLMVLSYLVVLGLILWFGGTQVIAGRMTAGELAQFIFYMQILTVPIRNIGSVVSGVARAVSSGERLFEVLDAESPVRESPQAIEMPRARGEVLFNDVDFAYQPGVPILKKINIRAKPGEVIALVGAPGSGKTTIVNLIPRFYDVGSGSITIDGMDVRDVSLKSLRRNIAIVQQDVFLFTASLRDNIAYGRTDATMEQVEAAARIAQLHDFIMELEDGYETVIGERGATLSGGQRQRLSIARAILLDPPILILDDSTSSVDAHTEEQIRGAMESVMRGRTTLVIAHRLGTVHRADQVLVLDGGEIVERGTHRELIEVGGRYRQVYELQLRPQEEVMLEFEMPAQATGEARR